RSRL
ncbi:molybdopterin oxidoreductase family protein, partial [Vibrio parahaemolyticus V-223/04]